MLEPLRISDFRLLWAGMTVSLLGDGLYVVAIAWQAYQISNSPYALAVTGVAWTLPTVLVLPVSGALSDRVGRRPLMIVADLLRAAAVGGLALLAVLGTIEVWHLVVLSVVFGAGEALFNPSFVALVPEIVPEPLLVKANSLDQAMRPLAMQFLGPALGGVLVASVGTGTAFALDAASYLFSAVMILLIRARPAVRHEPRESLLAEMGEGVAYVRQHVWLWGTLLAFSVTVLVFWGPIEVLVPYVIKNDLHGGAGGFGLVLAAGGAGAIVAAVATSIAGLPRQRLALCFASFIIAGFGTAFYGVATALWQMAVIAAVASMLRGGPGGVGDDHADAGAGRAAGAGLVAGLDGLDLAAAGVVRAGRPGVRPARCANDAGSRGRLRRQHPDRGTDLAARIARHRSRGAQPGGRPLLTLLDASSGYRSRRRRRNRPARYVCQWRNAAAVSSPFTSPSSISASI